MSKCQMRKYQPGGRCGSGFQENCKKEDTQGVSQAFSSYLAQREMFDKNLYSTSNSSSSNQIVVYEKKEIEKKGAEKNSVDQRKIDIDLILQGDF